MGAPVIHDDAFPTLVVVYPAGGTVEEFDGFINELVGYYQRGKVFAVVTDISRVRLDVANAAMRQYVAQRIDSVTREYPGFVVAEAVVAPSAVLRAVVTAYSWLKRDQTYPVRAFADRIAARTWCKQILERTAPL